MRTSNLKRGALVALLSVVIGLAGFARGGVILHTNNMQEQLDWTWANPVFNSTCMVVVEYTDDTTSISTGTLASQWEVQCSAHALIPPAGKTIRQVRVRFGNDARNPTHLVIAKEWFTPAGYTPGVGTGQDVGVVRLTSAITDITPMVRFRGNDEDLIGREILVAGYGYSGDGLTGGVSFTALKLGGTNVIDRIGMNGFAENDYFVLYGNYPDDPGVTLREIIEFFGDSGAEYFAHFPGEVNEWQGVASHSFSYGSGTYGTFFGGYRQTVANEFVDPYITSVPEPATAGMLFVGLGLVVLNSFRRSRVK